MNRIVIMSRVGSDGILQLALPVGTADAGREVQITVEPVGPPALSPDEWRQGILETVGKREPLTLDGLLRGVTDQNLHGEWDTGPAAGTEVW